MHSSGDMVAFAGRRFQIWRIVEGPRYEQMDVLKLENPVESDNSINTVQYMRDGASCELVLFANRKSYTWITGYRLIPKRVMSCCITYLLPQ